MLFAISANATELYSTLGPSGEFDSANGYFVDGSNFFNQVIASPFTVTTAATLTDAMLGLNNFAGNNNPVNLFVESDAGGVPGAILATLTQVGVIPPFNSMSLTMFTSNVALALAPGTTYWLVAQEPDAGTEQTWDFAYLDAVNGIAFNQLGSATGPWTTFTGTDVAFRINGTTGVPDRGSSLLLLGISLLAVGVMESTRRRRLSC
jgi:hypothetical protein